MTDQKEQIIGYRLQIDTAMNSFPYILPSREVSLCYTNLQRGFMWLGESLKALGSASPYVNSSNPAVATIEPQADHQQTSLSPRWEGIDQTQTARVKDFRHYLESLIQNFRQFKNVEWEKRSFDNEYYEFLDCLDISFEALKEAKCWLGWELNRIKKAKEAQQQASLSPAAAPLQLSL